MEWKADTVKIVVSLAAKCRIIICYFIYFICYFMSFKLP